MALASMATLGSWLMRIILIMEWLSSDEGSIASNVEAVWVWHFVATPVPSSIDEVIEAVYIVLSILLLWIINQLNLPPANMRSFYWFFYRAFKQVNPLSARHFGAQVVH